MDKKILALVGVVVIVIGLFLPIVSSPFGSLNMLLPGGGIGDGIFILVFALVAGGLALVGQVRHVVWPALLSLGFIAWKFFQLKGAVDTGRDRFAEQAGASEFQANYGEIMQINYLGWAVLCIGALVLLVAGIMAWSGPKAAAPPPAL
ncbi:MAG TPA: hypothetical protein VEX35_05670 [Allosphingosinicella sp.]|nr:hypothetical protein [Allosphingosinicella sp.]